MTEPHACRNCEGIRPESCFFNRSKPPSPYCAPYLTRNQTEEIWRLLHQQPQKKWAPHRRAFLKALRENAGSITYTEKP
jgi:plasmid stabilization system protein ParE